MSWLPSSCSLPVGCLAALQDFPAWRGIRKAPPSSISCLPSSTARPAPRRQEDQPQLFPISRSSCDLCVWFGLLAMWHCNFTHDGLCIHRGLMSLRGRSLNIKRTNVFEGNVLPGLATNPLWQGLCFKKALPVEINKQGCEMHAEGHTSHVSQK